MVDPQTSRSKDRTFLPNHEAYTSLITSQMTMFRRWKMQSCRKHLAGELRWECCAHVLSRLQRTKAKAKDGLIRPVDTELGITLLSN